MIKSSKVKIFKIFGVILCILSMTGCKPYLNKITEYEIKKNYIEYYDKDYTVRGVYIDYYVGKYNGYHILMLSFYDEAFLTEVGTETYDDIKISYGDSNRLEAYKNGNFTKLPDLYKSGELTKEDIVSIRDTFYQLKKENVPNNIEEARPKIVKPYLNIFTKNKIRKEYVEQFFPDNSPKDFYVQYYVGKYNGYRILMFSLTDKKYVNMPYLDKIGGVYINYSNSKRLIAYKDSEFYTLQELYEKEELTKKEIKEIVQTFNALRIE